MRYRVTHRTAYSYASQVTLCHNEAHLTPRSCGMQTVLAQRLSIQPNPSTYSEHLDFFGNHVAYFAVQQPHTELVVTAISEVELDTDNGQLHFQSNASLGRGRGAHPRPAQPEQTWMRGSTCWIHPW